jgi:hypothetical protein
MYAMLFAIPAMVIWVMIVWRLYVAAGVEPSSANRYSVILFFGTVLGMVVETAISAESVNAYCQGSWDFGRNHLVAAGACAILAAGIVSAGTLRSYRRERSIEAGAVRGGRN